MKIGKSKPDYLGLVIPTLQPMPPGTSAETTRHQANLVRLLFSFEALIYPFQSFLLPFIYPKARNNLVQGEY